ncbi:hypothetical protein C9374_001271 [Naegleria lovaniensis]|uniref:arginine--tRNA ligase n=1 Tax=Naegleria lovaniensis TaxID=51637 RepID=A0AA88GVD7_NAELO|nr:uncharacterized protein C9374_001271 [Naegleria lovaniensis]KAG2387677.1 hypothetical protein C9374_001271 [Naegleria lovaniensis]
MSQEKDIRLALAKLVITAVNKVYGVDISSMENDIEAKLELPKEYDMEHNIAFPCFALGKPLTPKKPKEVKFNDFIFQIASELTNEINTNLLSTNNTIVEKCKNEGPYINFYYLPSLLGSTIPEILSGSFLAQRPHKNENVMIEYSQPNTHKTFHVGHMRNAALGNSLVLLYEWCGYHVHAVNYIGDVGAHIAKCLWYFLYFVKKTTLEEFEAQELGREQIIEMLESARPQDIPHVEWLGELYTKGFYELDFASWTKYPLMGYITAKIEEINNHPSNDKWKVLKVTNGTEHFTVVCGGKDYKVNDVVPYAPLGSKKGARLVTEVDKQGVTSQGFILSEAELETSENKEKIHVFPADTPVGIELTELGRNAENVDPNITNITQEMKKREAQVKSLLRAMEDHQKNISMLWEITRQWSIDDFKEIYKWSDCRFDHYFHESDVGDESKEIVLKAYEEGKLIKSDGAIGADLGKQLGFCVLLTSAGTGLYATKDLALAKRKFEEFKVDRSVYVVDVSQSLHFQQVFKTLEILGFEQAKKCKHLAYGMVVLPDGKMSSRKGNIIYFSTLQKLLTEKIYQDFMVKYKGVWSDEEINETTRKIAISAIKYGMLNQDNNKDIVFDLKEWASKSGNTGPYLMYAYARAKSTLEKVGLVKDAPIDYGLLSHESEKKLLSTIRQFSAVVERAAEQYKPQLLCIFLYTLCKQFSKMYEAVSIKNAETEILKQTRLRLVSAFSEVLKHGLALLGITTAERM